MNRTGITGVLRVCCCVLLSGVLFGRPVQAVAQATEPPPPIYLPIISSAPPLPTPLDTRLYCANLGTWLSIPDNGQTSVSLHVDDSRTIVDLDVYLRASHTWVGDLGAAVTHEQSGKSIWFLDRPGIPGSSTGCAQDNLNAIFDDEANLPAEGRCNGWSPAISGTFQPSQALAAFKGESLAGDWRLTIADYDNYETGSVAEFCLEATVAAVPPATQTPDYGDLPGAAFLSDTIWGEDQSLPLDCEARSAVDWAGYLGYSVDEFDVFNRLPKKANPDEGFVGNVYGAWGQIPPRDYGVHLGPVAAVLNELGVPAVAYKDLAWDAVRAEIAANRPVEVLLAGWSKGNFVHSYYPVYFTQSGPLTVVSPYEHSVVVYGYTEDEVYLLDGASRVSMDKDEFLATWSVLRSQGLMRTP